MRLPFRQGLVAYQTAGGTPTFLQASTTAGVVKLVVEPNPTIVNFAHGSSNYLQVFDQTIDPAWAVTPGTTNWLYWDIDKFSGNVSYGGTLLEPVVSGTAPVAPADDQHWFDLTAFKMKVWSTARSSWLEVIRVFAGRVLNGNTGTLAPSLLGTQLGPAGEVPCVSGYLVQDTLLNPIKKYNGEFVTSEEPSHVRTTVNTSGVLVQPLNHVIPIRAGEAIPAMSLVYFSAADTVRLAASDPSLMPARIPVGIVPAGLVSGEVGTLVTNGEISYDLWDWSAHIGKPLYCTTAGGQLTTVRPNGLMAYRVGFVKNAQTILFNVDAETTPYVQPAGPGDFVISGVAPINVSDSLNGLNERVISVSIAAASETLAGSMSPAQVLQLNTHATRLDGLDVSVIDLQNTKANVLHGHVIADITGLQAALDGKSNVGHTHPEYALLGHTHPEYALLGHTHTIVDVDGLQTALNAKAFREHLTRIDEIWEDVDRSGETDQPIGLSLQDVLDDKSDVGHSHQLGELFDVNVAGAQAGQILAFNGSDWVNEDPPSGGGGGDPAPAPTVYRLLSSPQTFDGNLFAGWSVDLVSQELTIPVTESEGIFTFQQGGLWKVSVTGRIFEPFGNVLPDGQIMYGVEFLANNSANNLYTSTYPFSSYTNSGNFELVFGPFSGHSNKVFSFDHHLVTGDFGTLEVMGAAFSYAVGSGADVRMEMILTFTRLGDYVQS